MPALSRSIESTSRFAKDRRAHVQPMITHHELPITHVTRRAGRSPYVLVLTKTRALFTREAAERKIWTSDTRWLMQTARSFGALARVPVTR